MLKLFYPYEYVESIFAIDYHKLYQMGYRGIIFDIDNTLVHHGDDSTPEIDALFQEIHKIGLKTLLLSNNDTERIERFNQNIDSLYIPDADKPNTSNYYKALTMLNLPKEKVIMVGDQLFTDIYGANRCGMANILVRFIRLEGETKIGKKRALEKCILAFYRWSNGFRHRIGDIQKKGSCAKDVMETR